MEGCGSYFWACSSSIFAVDTAAEKHDVTLYARRLFHGKGSWTVTLRLCVKCEEGHAQK